MSPNYLRDLWVIPDTNVDDNSSDPCPNGLGLDGSEKKGMDRVTVFDPVSEDSQGVGACSGAFGLLKRNDLFKVFRVTVVTLTKRGRLQ